MRRIFNTLYCSNYIPGLILALIFFSIFTLHTLQRHNSFHSHAFDLGIYSQITYLYSQNLSPFSTLKNMPLLADHFGVILWIISPIYQIFPDAKTLLVIQSLFVSVSSIPIYLIALDKLRNKWQATLLILTYLSSVGIVQAVNFDFHLATISVFPISLIIWAWYFKRWRLYLIFLICSLLFKEDLPVIISGFGLFQISLRQFKIGLLTLIFGILSFICIKYIAMPFLWSTGGSGYIETSVLPLDSPVDLLGLLILRPSIFIDQFFNSPIKTETFQSLVLDYGLLPLLSPLFWLGAFPYLYLRFTSTYHQMWTTTYHHNANLEPLLVIAAIFVIAKYKIRAKFINLLLIVVLLTSGLAPNGLLISSIIKNFQNQDFFQIKKEALKTIPQQAAVTSQSAIIPHLANRPYLFLYPNIGNAEYIVLDPTLETYPLTYLQMQDSIEKLKNSPSWKTSFEKDGLIIFTKRN